MRAANNAAASRETGIAELFNAITLITILGLANARVWSAVEPLALKGLYSLNARGSAWLIMGISGGAALPVCYSFWLTILINSRPIG
jgi:fucose permease